MPEQITHATDGGAAEFQPGILDTSAELYNTVMDDLRADSTASLVRAVPDSIVGMLDFGLENVFGYSGAVPKGPPSVKDLIDQFDRNHIERQAERFLKFFFQAPADKKDDYWREIEEAAKQAERERIRLESLNTEDLETIDAFADAIRTGDFERVGQIVGSFKDNPGYIRKLLRGIELELQLKGLDKQFDVTAAFSPADGKPDLSTVTVTDFNQSPAKKHIFRTDGKPVK